MKNVHCWIDNCISWSMITNCMSCSDHEVLCVSVSHLHIGCILVSSLVWWRTHHPRKRGKSGKRNLFSCSLLSIWKIEIFEMLLLKSFVFKSIWWFDVVCSDIKAVHVSEHIVWIEFFGGLQYRSFGLLWFEGACQHSHITQQHTRAVAQLRHLEYHARYTFRCPSACLRSHPYVLQSV